MNGIQQIFPQTPSPAQSIADTELTDESLLAAYQPPQDQPWLSFNFVSSLDGAATVRGRSGGLGNDADQRIFKLLRCHADVILIGAQTVRVEGYTGELVDEAAQRWRERHGKPAHPPLAIVSGSLALDPTSELFTAA
ncbi:MAG: hypothetical protein HIU81_11805, partial [Acidobacteria bacterium]|nr:hypothetical protein [Acidobacteriota bacterium]